MEVPHTTKLYNYQTVTVSPHFWQFLAKIHIPVKKYNLKRLNISLLTPHLFLPEEIHRNIFLTDIYKGGNLKP